MTISCRIYFSKLSVSIGKPCNNRPKMDNYVERINNHPNVDDNILTIFIHFWNVTIYLTIIIYIIASVQCHISCQALVLYTASLLSKPVPVFSIARLTNWDAPMHG